MKFGYHLLLCYGFGNVDVLDGLVVLDSVFVVNHGLFEIVHFSLFHPFLVVVMRPVVILNASEPIKSKRPLLQQSKKSKKSKKWKIE